MADTSESAAAALQNSATTEVDRKTPVLSEEEIDDLIYFARAGEDADLSQVLKELAAREDVSISSILEAAKDEGKATCLHMAAANGHSKTVTQILSYFPTPSKPQPPSSTPSPSYINASNAFGNAALHWACLGGHLDTVKLLLSRGASPTVANDKDQIPLDLAAFNNHMHVVEYFLSQTKDIETENAEQGGLQDATADVTMGDGDDDAGEESSTGGRPTNGEGSST